MFNTNITIKDVQAVFTQDEINSLAERIENNKREAIEKEKQESFSDFIARSIENNKSTKKVEKNTHVDNSRAAHEKAMKDNSRKPHGRRRAY